jgi:hypothetical protein
VNEERLHALTTAHPLCYYLHPTTPKYLDNKYLPILIGYCV